MAAKKKLKPTPPAKKPVAAKKKGGTKAVKKAAQKAAKKPASKAAPKTVKTAKVAAKKSAPPPKAVPVPVRSASTTVPFKGVRVALLTGFGINSHRELGACFDRAGGRAEELHLNTLVENPKRLDDFHIFAIPGGFSFGDHLGSGRVLATRLRMELADTLTRFIAAGRPVLGICNGFQVLVKCGLLPALKGPFTQEVTLAHNDSGVFENRWVDLVPGKTPCVWLEGVERLSLPVRHGEGKLVADAEVLASLREGHRDALRYVDAAGNPTQVFPQNPNGSTDALAGLCDASGLIFGLMPHPEANMVRHHEPRWQTAERTLRGAALSRLAVDDGSGMALFHNAIRSVKIS